MTSRRTTAVTLLLFLLSFALASAANTNVATLDLPVGADLVKLDFPLESHPCDEQTITYPRPDFREGITLGFHSPRAGERGGLYEIHHIPKTASLIEVAQLLPSQFWPGEGYGYYQEFLLARDKTYLPASLPLTSLGLMNGDEIWVEIGDFEDWIHQPVGNDGLGGLLLKPVIYMYSNGMEISNATVEVELVQGYKFGLLFPPPVSALTDEPQDNETITQFTWNVTLSPPASPTSANILVDSATNLSVPYLCWDAAKTCNTCPPPFHISETQMHCVSRHQLLKRLLTLTEAFGFTPQERTDFITFWVPKMQAFDNVAFHFLDPVVYEEKFARLGVLPVPETLVRLFMVWKGGVRCEGSGPIVGDEVRRVVGSPDRKGWTVVEWGGMQLD